MNKEPVEVEMEHSTKYHAKHWHPAGNNDSVLIMYTIINTIKLKYVQHTRLSNTHVIEVRTDISAYRKHNKQNTKLYNNITALWYFLPKLNT